MIFYTLKKSVQSGVRQVKPQVDVAELKVGAYHRLDLERGQKLLLSLPEQPQLEVALAQTGFPIPVWLILNY